MIFKYFRRFLLILMAISLISCNTFTKDTSRSEYVLGFYRAMNNSNFQELKKYLSDSINFTDGGYTVQYSKYDFYNWFQWDSVFNPNYTISILEENDEFVKAEITKSCDRILFLNGEPVVFIATIKVKDGKVLSRESNEMVIFNDSIWAKNRADLLEWAKKEHPEIPDFFYDQTKVGGERYSSAIKLYIKKHLN